MKSQDQYTLDDASIFTLQGSSFFSQGKLREALECHQKSLAIQEKLDPGSIAVAKSYNSIGIIYGSQDKLTQALKWYQKSLVIKEGPVPNLIP